MLAATCPPPAVSFSPSPPVALRMHDMLGRFRVAVPSACVLFILMMAGVRAEDSQLPRSAGEMFEKSVRPVLAANCFSCHGPDKQKASLRLDARAALLTGGDSGPAIVPGHPEESLLVKAIHY